jgi:hypothetical protein
MTSPRIDIGMKATARIGGLVFAVPFRSGLAS